MTTLPQTTPMRFPRQGGQTHLAIPGPMGPGAMGPVGPYAPYAQGQGQHAGGLTGADVMRVLRANFWLIFLTVAAFAVGGYFFNGYLKKYYSRYTAYGLLEVYGADEIPYPGRPIVAANPAEIELTKNTQAKRIMHEANFVKAIQNVDSKIRKTKWFDKYSGHLDQAKEDLATNLAATPLPNSRLIEVTMTNSDPEDAKVILQELVQNHIDDLKSIHKQTEEKKVRDLDKENVFLSNQLNNDVLPALVQKEAALGADQVGTFSSYSGTQLSLNRLIEEELRIQAQAAGFEARLRDLQKSLDAGQTPPDIEQTIRGTPTYAGYRAQIDRVDVNLSTIENVIGDHSQMVVALKTEKATYEAKADQEHEELKSTYTEGLKSSLMSELGAAQANAQRIAGYKKQVSEQLGKLNTTLTEYKRLQKEETDLREKLARIHDDISQLKNYSIDTEWAAAQWGSAPETPDRPSFPKLPYTMAGALGLGLALSLGIAFLREMTDTTVRSDRDIAKVGQLNLLGMVQHEADDPQAAGARLPLAIFDAPHSMVAEQFRQVRTKLHHAAALDTTRSILVTSPSPGDGKSTVASNIAAGLALNGRRILLVDANFRRPSLHGTFGLDNATGFSDVLSDLELFDSAVAETDVPNLSVLVSGERPANPAELLENQVFIDFIERALEDYDHVIFDSGPMLVVSDPIAMAPRVDGVITVVRARGNSRGLLMRMRDELRKVKAEHLGVILNAVRSQGGGYYGRSIKTYYAYQNQ